MRRLQLIQCILECSELMEEHKQPPIDSGRLENCNSLAVWVAACCSMHVAVFVGLSEGDYCRFIIPYLAELVVLAQFLPKNHSSSAWLLLLCLVMMLGERSVIYPHLHQELWHLRGLATASVTWLAGQS